MSYSDENITMIISCEHAGNVIPAAYSKLFDGREEVLNSHRGYDIGALEIAERISEALKVPLYHSNISRLLVEANRSLDNKDLFSEFSASLTPSEKEKVIAEHYMPYRTAVTKAVLQEINSGKKVLHLGIHTFTPVLDGETRLTDIGLLFDPGRGAEKKFCLLLKNTIVRSSQLKVRLNYPYKGTDDGLTTELRKITATSAYSGIEIEVNQKYFTDLNIEKDKVIEVLTGSLKKAIQTYKENYL